MCGVWAVRVRAMIVHGHHEKVKDPARRDQSGEGGIIDFVFCGSLAVCDSLFCHHRGVGALRISLPSSIRQAGLQPSFKASQRASDRLAGFMQRPGWHCPSFLVSSVYHIAALELLRKPPRQVYSINTRSTPLSKLLGVRLG